MSTPPSPPDSSRPLAQGFRARFTALAASLGPGIFIVGYIIGTGSVTSMAAAGAKYGMSLTWALGLSCFFTYVMTVSISRVTILTGRTLLYNIRETFGGSAAIFIMAGLMLTVTVSVMGVMGIAADVLREWSRPWTPNETGLPPVGSVLVLTAALYLLFFRGRHDGFLKVMALLVAVMGSCFVLAAMMGVPDVHTVLRGLVPRIPSGQGASLILAGMVGTTMASVCLVTRSYLVAEKGWTLEDLRAENRDAAISLTLTFVVSAAIMASAAGTMFVRGIEVEHAIDMVSTLKPLAGRFATSLFVIGIVAAALSSLFPNYLLGPWLFFDVTNRPRRMRHSGVRLAVLGVALLGLVVPVFGGRPVILMIASQAVSPMVMPLLVVFVIVLLNQKSLADRYQNPLWLNIALGITLLFSLFMSYAAFVGLAGFFSGH